MSGLCFSELTEDELGFALREARRILRPGGVLLAADEVRSRSVLRRAVSGTLRFFPAIITYVLTQTTSRAVKNLPERAEEAGFVIESARLNRLQNFIELVCSKPREAA
jgi:SAM-dependent methyltransferase